jgi:cell division protein FtsI/penicillin-binding protein 2
MAIEERRRAGIRLTVLQYIITGLFSLLAVSFWVLQVVQHAQYKELAENNHQRTLALRAPRGLFSIETAKYWSSTAALTAFRSFASTPKT